MGPIVPPAQGPSAWAPTANKAAALTRSGLWPPLLRRRPGAPGASPLGRLRRGGPPPGPRGLPPPPGAGLPAPSAVCAPAPACRLWRRSASAFCAGGLRPAPLPRGVPPAAAAARRARSRAPGPGPPRGLPLAPALVRRRLRRCAAWSGRVPGLRAGPSCVGPGRVLPPAPFGALRSAPRGAAGAAVPAAPLGWPLAPRGAFFRRLGRGASGRWSTVLGPRCLGFSSFAQARCCGGGRGVLPCAPPVPAAPAGGSGGARGLRLWGLPPPALRASPLRPAASVLSKILDISALTFVGCRGILFLRGPFRSFGGCPDLVSMDGKKTA